MNKGRYVLKKTDSLVDIYNSSAIICAQIENNEVLVAATDSFVIPCNRLPNSFILSM